MTESTFASTKLAQDKRLHALCEALFPPGRILTGPDSAHLAATVAQYSLSVPAMEQCLQALLLALGTRFRARHFQSFALAPLKKRQSFINGLKPGSPTANLIHLISLPLRAAYLLSDENQTKMQARHPLHGPTSTESPQRWQQQVTSVDDLETVTDLEADVVVIGTGAGGAAAAYELASSGLAVVILEEGHYHQRDEFTGKLTEVIPKLYRASGATAAVGNSVIPIPVGKNVGGTTTINSGTCLRTPNSVLQQWQSSGLTEFSQETMEPYFQQVEAMLKVQPADPKYVGEIGKVIEQGAAQLGMKDTGPLLRNAEGCDGQGLCQFGCPSDAKQSTNVSYIPRALEKGAFLFTGLKAEVINWQGKQVTGLLAQGTGSDGIKRYVNIQTKQVVVAAGAFFTPLFLQKNGIKNRWLGKNLSIHPCGAVLGHYPDRRFNHAERIPQGYGVKDMTDQGILFEGGTPPFAAHGLLNPFAGEEFVDFTERWQHMGYFGFMIKDDSRGSVSRGPHADIPLIRYSMNQSDIERFRLGLETLAKMHLRAGAEYVHIGGYRNTPKIYNEQQLAQVMARKPKPWQLMISAYHPLGTARIAAQSNMGVCDSDHRVFGCSGLYVIDGSSVPSSLGANPQITIMAMALKAAEKLSEKIHATHLVAH